MSAELIYKTTSPDAISWWVDVSLRLNAQREARNAFIAEMTETYGVGEGSASVKAGSRLLWTVNGRASALDSGCSETPPVSSGWRLDSKDRNWKPALKLAAGKALAKRLAELSTVDPLRELSAVGVPQLAFAGSHMYRPGIEFDEGERALYVTWSSGLCAKEMEASYVDHVEWTEVPRSVWYARLEAKAVSS